MFFIFSGCEDYWQNHYQTQPETVDKNMWEIIQAESDLSSFVELVKQYKLDTLFLRDNTYTLFIPDNGALANITQSGAISDTLIKYHFINQFIDSRAIQGKRKLQTITKKYALFENNGTSSFYDEIKVSYESPLFLNGKYFVIDNVAKPKLSLYEYISQFAPSLKRFIDSKDSIVIDKEKSKVLGFDENGNTLYDTVPIIYNSFEEAFFPVREEFRNKTATLVYPRLESYNHALDEMATTLGGDFTDHTSIPEKWQQDILVPFLLRQGMFSNMVEEDKFLPYSDLDTVKLKNILGDSVKIFYKPKDRILSSNGYAYDYTDFIVPDSLFSGNSVYEAEWLLEETGINKFNWYNFVKVTSSIPLSPLQEKIAKASNDTVIFVYFPAGYSLTYMVEFYSDFLFPRDYRVIVGTHMDIGGIYNIYINDELVKTFDYYDYIRYRGILPSVTGLLKDRFIPLGRYNKFDFYVNNITTFSKAKIKFEYIGPGKAPSNGFVFDNIVFVPI